jgi:FO synthase
VRRSLRTAARLGVHQVTLTSGENVDGMPEIVSTCRYYGYASWFDYVRGICEFILQRNGRTLFFPQPEVGPIPLGDLRPLSLVAPSVRLMLHSADNGLQARPAHMDSPHKTVEKRLAAVEELGILGVPTVTGITVGIGEASDSWGRAAREVSEMHRRSGHIAAFVIKPFYPKPFSRMASAPPVSDHMLIEAVRSVRRYLDTDVLVSAELHDRLHLVPRMIECGVDDIGTLRLGSSERIDFEVQAGLHQAVEDLAQSGVSLVERLPLPEQVVRRRRLPGTIVASVERYRRMMAEAAARPHAADSAEAV